MDGNFGLLPYLDIRHSCQLYVPAALYPKGNFLVHIYLRGWVERRATECGQKQ